MKVAIVTINDINYGNRLQNYAVCRFLEDRSIQSENIYINDLRKKAVIRKTDCISKKILKTIIPMSFLRWNLNRKKAIKRKTDTLRTEKTHIFDKFTSKHMRSAIITRYHNNDIKKYVNQNEYDFFFAGSDQIWNPDFAGDDHFFLDFVEPEKRIAFAASIGYETLPDSVLARYVKYWKNMRYISVREQSAADLIEHTTGRKVDVFLDPTMLLTQAEWKEIEEKSSFELPQQYILCLFLGNAPGSIIKEYQKVYGMEVVILNDKEYRDYYLTGPSEFLYLIEHAELVLTDSFHCTVLSIIFHRDFVVFKRKDRTVKNMFTRLESLLDRLGFQDRVQECDGRVRCEKIAAERFDKSDDVMRAERERVTQIMNDIVKNTSDN